MPADLLRRRPAGALWPDDFGRERKILVSRHSGKAILRYLLQEQGTTDPSPAVVARLYDELIGNRTDAGVDSLDTLSLRVAEWLAASPAAG